MNSDLWPALSLERGEPDPRIERLVGKDALARAKAQVAQFSLAELVAHHGLLTGFDPIERARRFEIFQLVEAATREAATKPPVAPTRPVESLRRARRHREAWSAS